VQFTSEIFNRRSVLRKVSFSNNYTTPAFNGLMNARSHRTLIQSKLLAYDANPLLQGANAMPNLDFTLTGDYVELHNLLKITGLADSGGSAKMMVADGAVTVDGRVETRKTCKIRAGQVVLLGDTRIAVHEA
jgi:ribosome-associated protein